MNQPFPIYLYRRHIDNQMSQASYGIACQLLLYVLPCKVAMLCLGSVAGYPGMQNSLHILSSW